MNVLIISDADTKYGASKSLIRLVSELKRIYKDGINVNVFLIVGAWQLYNDVIKAGGMPYKVIYWPFYYTVPRAKTVFYLKRVVRSVEYYIGKVIGRFIIERHFDFDKIDVIHCNSSRIDLGLGLSETYGKPLVWHVREFISGDVNFFYRGDSPVKRINRTRGRIVVVSDAVKRNWIENGLDENKITRIYDGVTFHHEQLKKKKKRLTKKHTRIALMGGLTPQKGQEVAINALKTLVDQNIRDVRLYIIGDGKRAYYKKLKRLASELQLNEYIRFWGYVNDAVTLLSDMDIGIMCSTCEGFGLVLVEYMLCGLPVVSTDSGAAPEIIRDGIDGLLFKEKDAKSLSEGILQLVNDESKRQMFGGSGRVRAENCFSATRNAQAVHGLYEQLI